MRKPTFLLLGATAALGVAVMAWMRNPEPPSLSKFSIPEQTAPVRSPAILSPDLPDSAPAPSPAADAVPVAPGILSTPPAPSAPLATQPPALLTSGLPVRHAPSAAPNGTSAPVASMGKTVLPPTVGGIAGSALNPAPLNVELDRGVQLPAALLADEEPRTPAQEAVKKQIAQEFAAQMSEAVTASPKALPARWSSAQARANWEYQKFFGGEAANRASLRAGQEALAEP